MPIAASNVHQDFLGKSLLISGTLTFSGSYVQVGSGTTGEVFDPSVLAGVAQYYKCAPKLPYYVIFLSSNGTNFGFVPGTTLATGKIKATTTANTELTATTYPADITGDTGTAFVLCCPKD